MKLTVKLMKLAVKLMKLTVKLVDLILKLMDLTLKTMMFMPSAHQWGVRNLRFRPRALRKVGGCGGWDPDSGAQLHNKWPFFQ